MTNIDISPKAIERLRTSMRIGHSSTVDAERMIIALSAALDQSQDLVDRWINTSSEQDQTTYELREALTKSQAEVAAAYERAAEIAKWVARYACDTPDEMRGAAMVEYAILAAIPKGELK